MRFQIRKTLVPASALVLAATITGCVHLPPVNIGDPLSLDNTTIGSVNLDHMVFNAEDAGTTLAPATNFFLVTDPTTGQSVFNVMSGLVDAAAKGNPQFNNSLPPQLPQPPAVPDMHPDILNQLLADYIGRGSQAAPPTSLPPGSQGNANSAMRRLLEEQTRRLQEIAEERRREQQRALQEREEQLRRLLDEALRHRARTPDYELQLPLPFYLEGGSLDVNLPDFARLLVNNFKQDISISQLELTIPEGVEVQESDYPETLEIRGMSVTINAAQRNSTSVSQLLRFDETVLRRDESPMVFEHAGNGIYTPVDEDEILLVVSLQQAQARALFQAINNGYDIFGSADVALVISPQLAPQVALNFTIKAGDALIQP